MYFEHYKFYHNVVIMIFGYMPLSINIIVKNKMILLKNIKVTESILNISIKLLQITDILLQ